jgi:Tfp pilus assembly protein PilO
MFFIVLAFFSFFDICPKLWRMQIIREQIRIEKQSARLLNPTARGEQEKKMKGEVEQYTQQIQSLEQRWMDIQKKISGERNVATATMEIEDLAAAAKVTVTSINPAAAVAKGRYGILPQEIGLRGDYAALLDFLTKIEGAKTAMAIKGLSIRRVSPDDKVLDMDLTVYLLLADVSEKNSESSVKGLSK